MKYCTEYIECTGNAEKDKKKFDHALDVMEGHNCRFISVTPYTEEGSTEGYFLIFDCTDFE